CAARVAPFYFSGGHGGDQGWRAAHKQRLRFEAVLAEESPLTRRPQWTNTRVHRGIGDNDFLARRSGVSVAERDREARNERQSKSQVDHATSGEFRPSSVHPINVL